MIKQNSTVQIGQGMTKIQIAQSLILTVVVAACDTVATNEETTDDTSLQISDTAKKNEDDDSLDEHETGDISSSSEIDIDTEGGDTDSTGNAISDTESEAADDSDSETLFDSELKELGSDSDTESPTDDPYSESATETESHPQDSDTEGGVETDGDTDMVSDSEDEPIDDTASSSDTESTNETTVATETLPTDMEDTFTDDTDIETEIETETDSDTEEVASKLRICLSPGHPSSEGDKLYEAIINRKVAFYLEDLLLQSGYDVLIAVEDISRAEIFEANFDNEGDWEQSLLVTVSLDDRVDICNNFDADYFISLHHNAFEDPTPNYTLTLYAEASEGVPYSEDTVEWAELTTEYLTEAMSVTGGYTRGDRSFLGFGLKVLQETTMPAILTEGSFYTNPDERLLLNQNDYLEGEAGAIFDGFTEFQQMLDDAW